MQMSQRTDVFDLDRLSLRSGEARQIDLEVSLAPFAFGGQSYTVAPEQLPVRLDVSRTTGNGWALRLRLEAELQGPCVRCLEPASPSYAVDAREVDQPGGGDELQSPYVDDGDLDMARWTRDALALTLPTQITCRADCRGLCPECGVNLNEAGDHQHEKPADTRWSKLSELKFD